MKKINETINLGPVKKLLTKHNKHTEEYRIQLGGIEMIMLPGVFCPAYTHTSDFLAENVEVFENEKVLDVFSGSGYQGIKVAKNAKSVVAVDNSPIAVECIRKNIRLHKLTDKMKALKGDLFEPVADEKFDVVIASPPLLPGTPETILEAAVLDPGLSATREFLEQVSDHLTSKGRVYLVFSNVGKRLGLGGISFVKQHTIDSGLTADVIASKDVGYETYSIILLRKTSNIS